MFRSHFKLLKHSLFHIYYIVRYCTKRGRIRIFDTYTIKNSYFILNYIFIFGKNGQTALHSACMKYDPSNQKKIDVCVALIEANADAEVLDKVNCYFVGHNVFCI